MKLFCSVLTITSRCTKNTHQTTNELIKNLIDT